MIATLARDVHLAARALFRSPGFTFTAGLTLALGIAATAAASAVLGSVLFAPLPYPEPARLVSVWDRVPGGGTNQVSPPNFADWVEQARSSGVFEVLGVEPALGRRVQAADVPGGRVVVLSDGLWQRRFGRDPGVVGRVLRVDGEPHEIVGVMPPGFRLPGMERAELTDADLWAPIERDPCTANRGAHGLIVLARLRPGVTAVDARQDEHEGHDAYLAYAGAAAVLGLAALAASYLPARRAAGVDPVRVLRQD